jgi:hypothetical protein
VSDQESRRIDTMAMSYAPVNTNLVHRGWWGRGGGCWLLWGRRIGLSMLLGDRIRLRSTPVFLDHA